MESVTCDVLCNILSYMKSSSVGHQFASTTLSSVLSELLQRVKDKVDVLQLFMHSLNLLLLWEPHQAGLYLLKCWGLVDFGPSVVVPLHVVLRAVSLEYNQCISRSLKCLAFTLILCHLLQDSLGEPLPDSLIKPVTHSLSMLSDLLHVLQGGPKNRTIFECW